MSKIDLAITAAAELADEVDGLRFGPPVSYVYNPLRYAWAAHCQYLRLLNPTGVETIFLGMNPGPWGMAQTGVPFGQVAAVRDWLKIDAEVGHPPQEHSKRPVEGLRCPRSEVSGQRLWGLFQERFGTPKVFFKRHFVANYCPLIFLEASARNRTPDKLPVSERAPLDDACDRHLGRLLQIFKPRWLVGVGVYAENCLRRVSQATDDGGGGDGGSGKVVRILHPSPASPAANRGWAEAATEQLIVAGVWK